ncbi:MazG nucleotide pyrophosphohydrolase domain-containing protein [Francisella tularensis]|uniref:MazG nucleotide pyrophosphohydrolase domain-containing protein n=1 Tax=Francisella tularensis TaxID=263 RepID=UPI000500CD32|nr:MazG nucleotide pyrophosphohydrolase domain-containing protein [Francisella tularensis]AJI64014.1 mazG nucleotide pyrophosphohydrolase domain protein [Francisella tularensis subsp. tularensis]KFJ64936.1 mazG nucleotide pyrophosphohydrolase domain protein [Francisella tularensis]MBK2015409.1 nucleotide pyrophosphohydrolase [Francisella tularensis subsp. tularensis]MBK2017759.1 nucleotide pyrophosphohydrolase [Francisella tularensis subsp. tularensis]MBK2018323.1 nucleotide pyrophosphohydrola
MQIKQAQQTIAELLKDIIHPRLASFIALSEEVGELANEIMKKEIYEETNDNQKIKAELTDVFVSLLELANVYNIDLETEFIEKIQTLEPRVQQWNKAKALLKAKRTKLD